MYVLECMQVYHMYAGIHESQKGVESLGVNIAGVVNYLI